MLFSKAHKFKKVESTNSVAFDLAKKGAKEGEYVISEVQSKGRGRLNRKWHSKAGNLYISLILRPSILACQALHMTFVAALAVAKTLEKYAAPQLKWPNDILIDGKKVCGILSEACVGDPRVGDPSTQSENVDFIIVGMGINVNQEKFPKSLSSIATSLRIVLGKSFDLEEVCQDLLASFEEWYNTYLEKGFPFIKEMWEERSLIKGRAVEVKDGRKKIRGVALGLNSDGALIIKTPHGETLPIYSGDLACF